MRVIIQNLKLFRVLYVCVEQIECMYFVCSCWLLVTCNLCSMLEIGNERGVKKKERKGEKTNTLGEKYFLYP